MFLFFFVGQREFCLFNIFVLLFKKKKENNSGKSETGRSCTIKSDVYRLEMWV